MSDAAAATMIQRLPAIIDYLTATFPAVADPQTLWSHLSKALREAVPLNRAPAWTDELKDVLIDWHELLFEDSEQFHDVFNQRERYTFHACFAELETAARANQLAMGSDFLIAARQLAALLTAANQTGLMVTRLAPHQFIWYGGRIDADWPALADVLLTAEDRILKVYDMGWMHSGLRKRDVPADLSRSAATTHAYAYLLLWILTGLPPAANQQSLLNQIERFRAYNPCLPPDLRAWLRHFLQLPPESQETPLDCWYALDALVRAGEAPCDLPGAAQDVAGDSVFGRNKRSNQNEDFLFTLTVPGVALLAVADGVSTAEIGTGGQASFTIREVADRQKNALLAQLQGVLDIDDWEATGWSIIEDFFESCHRAVVDKINSYLTGLTTPEVQGTMSSTLVLALVHGNRALIGHWGDSRAYRVSPYAAVRLTEDHNQDLEALVASLGATGYQCPEQGAPLVRVLGQSRYDPTAGCRTPVEQKVSRDTCWLAPDEWLLLCSDGLLSGLQGDTESEKEGRLAAITARFQTASCRELARQLVRTADDERGDDNITALLLRVRPAAEVSIASADTTPDAAQGKRSPHRGHT